jgi:cytochrome c553
MASEPGDARATAPSHPSELDKPWRRWASFIIVGMLGFSIVAGFLVIPVMQGLSAGISPFDAICRAVGITAGSPAMRQPESTAAAAPTTRVAWSTELMRTLARPTSAGTEVAQQCVACHGERGVASDPQNPNLAGQSAVAIYKQLNDYKSGSRVHELMTPLAQGLEDAQIEAVAAHFAFANRLALDPTTAQVVDEDIVRLVERGDPARSLPACNSCHGANAGGPIETPTISKQNKQYLSRQLHAFKDASRKNDIYTRMRSVAAKLSDREIEKLADFYATTLSY